MWCTAGFFDPSPQLTACAHYYCVSFWGRRTYGGGVRLGSIPNDFPRYTGKPLASPASQELLLLWGQAIYFHAYGPELYPGDLVIYLCREQVHRGG